MRGHVGEKGVEFAQPETSLSNVEEEVITQENVAQAQVENQQVDDGEIGQIAKGRMCSQLFLGEHNEGKRITNAANK